MIGGGSCSFLRTQTGEKKSNQTEEEQKRGGTLIKIFKEKEGIDLP